MCRCSLLFPQLFETLSPAYVFKGAPAANQAMLAVMGILNTVYLPRGKQLVNLLQTLCKHFKQRLWD